ncbi:MAG: hypothetical protein OXU20_10340 [Myxococcales bacterium]|nr:hypothetical protein [Myxococcales bacterium]MDD9965033.1 hypothetical protein [Myxococcales bacterium]
MKSRLSWKLLVHGTLMAVVALGCGGDDSSSGGGAGTGSETGALEDPNVDYSALTLIYSPMYSAWDGEHVFQVPVYANGVQTEPEDWTADPPSAVSFDSWQSDDGAERGILVTVLEPEPEVTLRVANGSVGGKATLYITKTDPAQWAVGEDRYKNGETFNPADIGERFRNNPDLLMMIEFGPDGPQFTGDAAALGFETSLRCDSCHTKGADNFQVQHTPTQAARYSDDELIEIFTNGMKPPGVEFRVLPERFQSFYSAMHTWDATDEQRQGLVTYLRSLTPEGQGDILLPTGMLSGANFDLSQLPPVCNPTGGMFDRMACREMLPEVCRIGTPEFNAAECGTALMMGM